MKKTSEEARETEKSEENSTKNNTNNNMKVEFTKDCRYYSTQQSCMAH